MGFTFPVRPLRSGVWTSPLEASHPQVSPAPARTFQGVELSQGKAWLNPRKTGSEAPLSENSAQPALPSSPKPSTTDLPRRLVASSRSHDIILVPKHIHNTLALAHAPKPSLVPLQESGPRLPGGAHPTAVLASGSLAALGGGSLPCPHQGPQGRGIPPQEACLFKEAALTGCAPSPWLPRCRRRCGR